MVHCPKVREVIAGTPATRLLLATAGLWLSLANCNGIDSTAAPNGPSGGSGNARGGSDGRSSGGFASGGAATGGACVSSGGSSCVTQITNTRPHPGIYDYKSCMECHGDTYWGGWVYSNAAGDAWVAGATVTVTNADGSAITKSTAKDGFFDWNRWDEPVTVGATFTPCVSKCNDRTCSPKEHNSADCQNPNCHGATNHLIYLTQSGQNTCVPSGTDCKVPASGGARVHETSYDDQTCASCHDATYMGGYVYAAIDGGAPVSMATLTITPNNGGNSITAVTGPGGMFHIKDKLTAPYYACISKCPDNRCSGRLSHPNVDDCSTCHNSTLRIHLP